jgi:hypothetical protein
MRNVLIIENSQKGLDVINEGVTPTGEKAYKMQGIFTELGVTNRNDRIYTEEGFLPALNEMQSRMETLGTLYGEFDHPDSFDMSLQRASHVISKVDYVKESRQVTGEIQLLSTYWGKEAKAIVNDGHSLFVSSRAAGITEGNGQVSLKKLFTYDIVADPGFGSAKMSSINESCGFQNNSNFRIYEMNDEAKINDLFNMNKNDMVTKAQLSQYSGYLTDELAKTRNKVNEAVKVGQLDAKKLDELMTYYSNLQEDHAKLVGYLDYLAEKMQVVVNENKALKSSQAKLESTQTKLIKHNDYIAENLEKAINYSEYLAENLDSNIRYNEYIAENVDKLIDYSEYIAENLDCSIAYTEYIAEHLDDNIAYSDYIAENLDKSINLQSMISEKLNGNKLFENHGEEEERFPTPEDAGFDMIDDQDEEGMELDFDFHMDADGDVDAELEIEGGELEGGENCRVVCDDDEENVDPDFVPSMDDELVDDEDLTDAQFDEEAPVVDEVPTLEEEEEEDDCDCGNEDCNCNEEDLDTKIDKLIEEAKKRKASETNEHHFLKFLNKTQVDAFYSLEQDDKEKVVAYINEKDNYMSDSDVLRLMQEALSVKAESLEEKLIRLMPNEVKTKWDKIEESQKVSILSQARLYPELVTESQIEHFWLTRPIKVADTTKQLISESKYIQEDKLSDEAIEGIMERFKNLK